MILKTLWILFVLSVLTDTANTQRKRDCSDASKRRGNNVYRVNPDGKGGFKVYCDMKTDGGNWTVFQRRRDGQQDFYLGWKDYKNGFGKLMSEFWLGNDKIHRLTANRRMTLRIDLTDWQGRTFYAAYRTFAVGDEESLYKLDVRGYSGNAGNALFNHRLMAFSTKDKDNDKAKRSCAEVYHGGWWFRSCMASNLNGEYLGNHKSHDKGVVWLRNPLRGISLKFTEMKMRPAE